MRRSVLATLLATLLLGLSGPAAQAGDRVDATLPELAPVQRGERITTTRPLREASEARLRDDLARWADLDRLANPHFDRPGAYPAIYPSVFPQDAVVRPPCVGSGCLRPPQRPQPLPQPLAHPMPQPLPQPLARPMPQPLPQPLAHPSVPLPVKPTPYAPPRQPGPSGMPQR